MKIFVRVKKREQYEAVMAWGQADVVIVDYSLAGTLEASKHVAGAGPEIYISLPDVLREYRINETERIVRKAVSSPGVTGVVIKNLDELGMIKDLGFKGPVIGDPFLYAYNSEAVEFYREQIPGMMFIASDELNDRELSETVGTLNDSFIYKAYGYQPLMVTSQCLQKNYSGCLAEGQLGRGVVKFTDDKGSTFFSECSCGLCYNVIYSGQPVYMLDKIQDSVPSDAKGNRQDLPYQNILMDFTVEDGKQVRRVLALTANGAAAENVIGKYSRGHHYKGVD